MIIGLTGSIGSGKGVVSDLFQERGFTYFSLSNEVREAAKKENIELTRENLQNLGNRLREEKGSGVLAELVIEKINNFKYKNAIVDGIRNPKEIDSLKKLKSFFLISVDAFPEIRFKRVIERNRESDPKTWEDFMKIDNKDKGIGEKETGQGVGKCMERADFMFMNNGSLEDAREKAENVYQKILLKIPRPSWDEYFMKIASLVAERSTCLRHHVGAVVVKDKRLLTMGYNGAARGTKDCTEAGCLRNELNIPSGTRHEICRAIHAEQNSIIQAGTHGISINGGTIYCTHTPCMICAKMIVNAGIREVISYQDYADEEARTFLTNSGVLLRKINKPDSNIEFKD